MKSNISKISSIDSFKIHRSQITSIKFSPTSTKLFTSSRDNSIITSTISISPKSISIIPSESYQNSSNFISSISLSSSSLLSSSWDGFIRLYKNNSKTPIIINTHLRGSTFVTFSPNGKFILSCGFSGEFSLYSLDKNEILCTIDKNKNGHKSWVTCAAFLTDNFFVTGGDDGRVLFWEIENYDNLNTNFIEMTLDSGVTCLSTSRDKRFVAVGTRDGNVAVFDARNSKNIGKSEVFVGDNVNGICVNPIRGEIIAVVKDKKLCVVNVMKQEVVEEYGFENEGDKRKGKCVEYSEDGGMVAVGFDNG